MNWVIKKIKDFFHHKNKYDAILDGMNNIHKKVYLEPIQLPSDFDDSKPTVLITDDHEGILYIFRYTMDDIEKLYKDFKISDYNFIYVSSIYAVHRIFKYLSNIKIDYLITDLTFGGRCPNDKNEMIGYDGVDLIIDLRKKNPDLHWMVFTGHIIGHRSHKIDGTQAKKLFDYDETMLYNKSFFKDDVDFDRNQVIHDFLKTGEFDREEIILAKRRERENRLSNIE